MAHSSDSTSRTNSDLAEKSFGPLHGKVALVTGASRGIGKGIALELAARGADVAVNYVRSGAAAADVVAQIQSMGRRSITIQADLSSVPEITRMFEELVRGIGKPDIVVSNSGMECFVSLEETTSDVYDEVMNLNTRAQFFVAQQGYICMNNNGRIILMSSVAAHMRGFAGHALYPASKAAVEAMVRSLPEDFAPKKVTINAIAPGGVESDMSRENAWRYNPEGKKDIPIGEIYAGLAALNPLRRFGTPQDIAKTVAFLASDESEWINGQTIGLTGGSRS